MGAGVAAALVVVGVVVGCGGSSSITGAGRASGATPPSTGTVPASARSGLAAQGAHLYETDGCDGCHSLNGTRLTGPSWKGLAGSRVALTNGHTVIATDAYLTRHIVQPNALTVRGYPSDVMAQAIEELHLQQHPEAVRALVAFIDSLR